MTTVTMNESELLQLKENYINMIIDGMDMDSLCQMAFDLLLDSYQDASEDEMLEEIKDLYDEEREAEILKKIDELALIYPKEDLKSIFMEIMKTSLNQQKWKS